VICGSISASSELEVDKPQPSPAPAPAASLDWPSRRSDNEDGKAAAAEETAWLAEWRAGDRDAFTKIVERYHTRLYHYLSHLCGNPSDAEDLLQDTFIKAFRALDRFDGRCPLGVWLFTIAKHTALNHLRANWRNSGEEVPEGSYEFTPAMASDEADERQALWTAARQLKPAQFEALWLRYGQGFNIEEIAGIMKTNRLRVRVLLHRGRSALVKALGHTFRH
jgi:RNA polymerase sigma-70 factor (ECF subfamily)